MAELIYTNKWKLFAFFLLISLIGCNSNETKVNNARKIKVGMSVETVEEIMGSPDKKQCYKQENVDCEGQIEAYYYNLSKLVSSEDIIVWFDYSGKVEFVSSPSPTKNPNQ